MEDRVYDLDRLDGHEFEAAVVELFQRLGYSTERGKLSNDEGRDIVLRTADAVIVVECKHQRASVGRPVVQKLHSAIQTFGAREGIIVTTGGFSSGATEYVRQNRLQIQLWDFARLAERGKQARVFFAAERHGTKFFFHVPGRSDRELREHLWARHISSLKSSPRPVTQSVQVQNTEQQVLPVIVVDYRVDKPFRTQAGLIYYAQESGRRFFPVSGQSVSPFEEEYWRNSRITMLTAPIVDGKPPASYFGRSLKDVGAGVATEVAHRLSRVARYAGRNNQAYSKYCQVGAGDVEVTTRQVFLLRH